METNTGKARELCQSGKMGTLLHHLVRDPLKRFAIENNPFANESDYG